MNQMEELTAKIHKHCPELMELSTGCRVYDSKAIDWARDLVLLVYTPKGKLYFREPDGSVFHTTSSYLKQIEILGHPITLEHVLKAIDEEAGSGFPWEIVACTTEVRKLVEMWNLTKPLSEQSPELIEWLNQIVA